jgi:hypothetical protein
MNEDEKYYCYMVLVFMCSLALCLMMISGCSTAEFNKERPIVKIWSVSNGALWRKQSKSVLGLPMAEGYLCTSPEDMEKLLSSFSEPYTVPAK